MHIDFLLDIFALHRDDNAIAWRRRLYTFGYIAECIARWQRTFEERGIRKGSVTAIDADFSPNAIALFLALVQTGCIVVPMARSAKTPHPEFIELSSAEFVISLSETDASEIRPTGVVAAHPLYHQIRSFGSPGLVLFSSGSSGQTKAAVHDLSHLLTKYRTPRHRMTTLSFLLFDHIGGVNTLLHTLSNAGLLVTVEDRSPDAVCAAIERFGVELLPTSPTFLNLLLLSEAYARYDLGTLHTITYGTEPMPAVTLQRLHEILPDVTLQQTYGLSELGILRSKSESSSSLWVKLGGEGISLRVVDGVLQIRSDSMMLGYLNAPSPFTNDGWFDTGDVVDVNGEYYRFRGRRSESINVGGEKVFPAEIETVILEIPGVLDAAVFGERNPITGMIVCARVQAQPGTDPKEFARQVRDFCRRRLQPFKVPVKVSVTDQPLHGERFKKKRGA